MNTPKTLRLILGDQLNAHHSWFQTQEENVTYYMAEVHTEATYVAHHIQKMAAFFLAMRAFADQIRDQGHQVAYFTLEMGTFGNDLIQGLKHFIEMDKFEKFEYQEPDEFRLDRLLADMCASLQIPTYCVPSEHFLTNRNEASEFFKGKKTWVMETFYRHMRKKFHILIDTDGQPAGGTWNFDTDNRKPFSNEVPVPDIPRFHNDASEIYTYLEGKDITTIGEPIATIDLPISRAQALVCLKDFVTNRLPYFGTYEDAMHSQYPILFHSMLSFALNVKLLSPLEVVHTAVKAYYAQSNRISLAQIEGFVRQIIGWREYMRGIYWQHMPSYARLNFFDHHTPMPSWYWTGNTKMHCMQKVISQSLHSAYAHHIQRLMVVGNFSLLSGLEPDDVDQWYLGIYADAIEWVQLPNTRGMSQYADGGLVGTKPYVASANYIDKMSNYCKNCHYDKVKKVGDKACPFNSLYWDFYQRHQPKLQHNMRIKFAYQTWNRFSPELKETILAQAKFYKNNLNYL